MTRTVVELLSATFKTRLAPDGARSPVDGRPRVDCDFVLRMNTPSGPQEWCFGFNAQDLDVSGLGSGVQPEQLYRLQMETMFSDLISDLAEYGWVADKSFDEVPLSVEIPDDVLASADAHHPRH
jgi:hypothetical protein